MKWVEIINCSFINALVINLIVSALQYKHFSLNIIIKSFWKLYGSVEAMDLKRTLEFFGYDVPYVASSGEKQV